MPAAISAMETPHFEGVSGDPVMEVKPASHCISKS